MILIDYLSIAVSSATTKVQSTDLPYSRSDIIRHMILNSIRSYNKQFREQYGEMVIACDSSSWRRDYYPLYKHSRRESRKKDDKDKWNEIFDVIDSTKNDLVNHFPYKVLSIDKCEADDIIGTLVLYTQEFGKHENVMIISSDKDFVQLQRYSNVKQFSPRQKKEVIEKKPIQFLFEHIIKGDSGDGVPNVLSPDDIFTKEGVKQRPITQKLLDNWKDNMDNLPETMGEDVYRNYDRNRTLIDLTLTPNELQQKIIEAYENCKPAPNSAVLKYLIKHNMRNLTPSVQEFHQ